MGIPMSQRSALAEFFENKSKSHVRLGDKSKSRKSKKRKISQKVMKFREQILFDLQLWKIIIISKSGWTVLSSDRLGSRKRNIEPF